MSVKTLEIDGKALDVYYTIQHGCAVIDGVEPVGSVTDIKNTLPFETIDTLAKAIDLLERRAA